MVDMEEPKQEEIEWYLLVRGKIQITLGLISLKKKKFALENVLEEQKSLLDAGFSYSIKSEIELNDALMQYVNECIYTITRLQKCNLLDKLNFPIQHNLLRFWRDYNHHESYLAFRPVKSRTGVNFYIWPILSQVSAVWKKYPNWCKTANRVELKELIQQNHEYIEGVVKHASEKPIIRQIAFSQDYQYLELHFGSDTISNEASWDMDQ